MLGQVPTSPLPSLLRAPQISDLFPDFPILPPQTLMQVQLTQHELSTFSKLGTDMEQCTARIHNAMPTALHSWGNQLTPCECGCRQSGLSMDRMLSRGFFGTVIAVPTPHGISYRRPAPAELAILVGMPCQFPATHPARLIIAGLGQIASPIQSSWLFGALKDHVLHYGLGNCKRESIRSGLGRVCQTLFEMRDQIFPTHVHTIVKELLHMQSTGPTTNHHRVLPLPSSEGVPRALTHGACLPGFVQMTGGSQ